MIKNIFSYFNKLDKKVKTIMKYGLYFCSILGVISLILLATYNLSISTPFLYIVGLSLFKISLIFGVEFIICGFAADKVKSQLL